MAASMSMGRSAFVIGGLIITLLAYASFAWPRITIDGLIGEPFDLLGCTDTQYGDGYSHWGFKRIEIGMTEQEVIAILGEPFYRWAPYGGRSTSKRFPEKAHFIGLVYSRSPSSTHYRLRQVNLDNGFVVEIRGYFYVD
jgi:hypothetical protein